jgi:hypothetical protein
MIDRVLSATSMLMPVLLGIYALAFVAGGVYILEQRVARIRDQFPTYGPITRLTGYAALGIGLLAALAVGGHVLDGGVQYQLAACTATASGIGFWVTRIHIEMTAAGRIRAALLAVLCLALTVLTARWVMS